MSQESKNQGSDNSQDDATIKQFIAANRPLIRQALKHIFNDHESAKIVHEELKALKAECPPCAVACDPWPPFLTGDRSSQ